MEMEIIKDTNKTLSGDDLGPVVVTTTTTVVEKTEVSVVEMVRKEDELIKNQEQGELKEGYFGDLVGEDEGSKGNRGENGASVGFLAGKNGVLADEHDKNASGDPMDICSSEGNEKNNENRAETVEQKEDTKNGEENVKNGEAEEEDHSFVVGDFVWGKIKSHPWWPGQIYDPSDASDYAATIKRKGGLLVAYFGDRSFSWCSPSQLKPFIDNFQEMSSQSDSKKFVNAVQEGLEVVSMLVKPELMCKCQKVDTTENAGVVNGGIKEGVRVPKGNTIRVLRDRVEPVELVSTLKRYAIMEPGTRSVDLELAVLKSFLSAFYAKKGGYLLVDYHDPMCIEGLEEETRGGVVGDSDVVGPLESPENGDDKLYQKRKQKSVAELLGEDESKVKKAKTSKDGGMKDGKRKVLVVSVTPESDHASGDGGGVEGETMSPRQRKKSRYLSPPYLSPVGSGRFSVLGSGSFRELKTEPEKDLEMADEELEGSLKKKSSGKRTREKRRLHEGSESQEHEKKMDAAVNVTEVLDGLLCAALDPSSFVEKEEDLPTITELVSSFRSSVFEEGSHKKTGKKKDGEDAIEDGSRKKTGKKKNDEEAFEEGSRKKTGKKKEGEDALEEGPRKKTGKKKDGEDAFEEGSRKKTGKKKDGKDPSEEGSHKKTGKKKDGEEELTLEFIKQKVEWMSEMVQTCGESEMNADVKASLQDGMQEVLEKVAIMRGK